LYHQAMSVQKTKSDGWKLIFEYVHGKTVEKALISKKYSSTSVNE
jgi:hypothetical protein